MMHVKVCKDKHISSRWADLENLIYVDEIASKIMYKDKEGDQWIKNKQDTEWSKVISKYE